MWKLFQDIDALLRGRFTRRESLLQGKIEVPVGTLVKAGLLLGMVYGAFMGLYSVLRIDSPSWAQLTATTAKVPLLFLLTLVVTFPSLYVFSALANSRLRRDDTLRLLLAAVGVNLALLASFGPVTGFFTLSTDSYPFMVLLNVVFFAISGFVGLGFLRKAVGAVFSPAPTEPGLEPEDAADEADDGDEGSTLPASTRPPAVPVREPVREPVQWPLATGATRSRRVFAVWTLIYAVVGAQMGWILRPFVGTPAEPFQLFRARESNFFRAILDTLEHLFF